MQLTLQDNLPFITIILGYQQQTLEVANVLVDTGSASTIIATDSVTPIGISPQPDDILYTIRGVGGREVVFTRQIDYLQIDNYRLNQFTIEVGAMDYGFAINGILGMDFLIAAQATIDLNTLQLTF